MWSYLQYAKIKFINKKRKKKKNTLYHTPVEDQEETSEKRMEKSSLFKNSIQFPAFRKSGQMIQQVSANPCYTCQNQGNPPPPQPTAAAAAALVAGSGAKLKHP